MRKEAPQENIVIWSKNTSILFFCPPWSDPIVIMSLDSDIDQYNWSQDLNL